MKKFLAILLSVVVPALSFGAVQYADGMFSFDKEGDVLLQIIEKGTVSAHVGEVGYFVSFYDANEMLDNNLKGGDKTLGPFHVETDKTYGFYMTLAQGNSSKEGDTYYSAANGGEAPYFSFNAETNTASFTLLNGYQGAGNGNNTLTFALTGSAVSDETNPTGAPLPGTMASIALCMGAVAATKRFGKKKQNADKN